jgi:hypothetical protein
MNLKEVKMDFEQQDDIESEIESNVEYAQALEEIGIKLLSI